MFIVISLEGLYLTGAGEWSTRRSAAFEYRTWASAKRDADARGGYVTPIG